MVLVIRSHDGVCNGLPSKGLYRTEAARVGIHRGWVKVRVSSEIVVRRLVCLNRSSLRSESCTKVLQFDCKGFG